MLRAADSSALRVYTTTNVTRRRIYTLMHDPTYRAQVAFEPSGYNQPPHSGFQISPNMPGPPKPNIRRGSRMRDSNHCVARPVVA